MIKRNNEVEDNPYGISIADLMTGLLSIIILVLFSVMLRLEVFREEKASQIEVIDERELIKRELVAKLIKELSEYEVDIDPQTGVIRIKEGILFDFGKYDIKPKGEEFLKKFVPEYVNILLSDPEICSNLSQIIIEGHTDRAGTYEYNLGLSLDRAKSVALYISEEMGNFPYKEAFRNLLTVNGRSFEELRDLERPLDEVNRRVEFKFRLKDWDIINSKKHEMEK
jgi:chemotaxis protein MotB